jgi:hypothetical protein
MAHASGQLEALPAGNDSLHLYQLTMGEKIKLT